MNFDWRWSLSEEGPGPLFIDTSDTWVAPTVVLEQLTAEEQQKKSATVKKTQGVGTLAFL
jgi:hypothetical protein